jgi:lysozyme
MRHITQRGLDFIKQFEAFSEYPYHCQAGKKTIGWGHVILDNESIQEPLSEEDGEILLKKDVQSSERAVFRNISVPLSDGQFDALVSFTFNCGAGSLQASTLRSKINRGEYPGAADEFIRWNKVHGKISKGLTRRRMAEAEMFRSA